MTFFNRLQTSLFIIGTGAVLSLSAAALIYLKRVNRRLIRLIGLIEKLSRDIEEIKQPSSKIKQNPSKSNEFSSFKDVSSDEEEDYEDTIDDGEYNIQKSVSIKQEYFPRSRNLESLNKSVISLQQLTHTVDQLFKGADTDKELALSLLQNNEQKFVNEAEFLWRFSQATFIVSQMRDCNLKKAMTYKAFQLAKIALAVNELISDVHKWYAVTLGSIGEYEGIQQKIQNGYKFKEHIERAIELNKSDATCYHLLGRWCYEVYMLKWYERKIAATLFETPPTSTVQEALGNFREAQRCSESKWKENDLYMAKCFIEKRDYKSALEYLDDAFNLPPANSEEVKIQQEIELLITQYEYYRI